jgi:hypothetical protein
MYSHALLNAWTDGVYIYASLQVQVKDTFPASERLVYLHMLRSFPSVPHLTVVAIEMDTFGATIQTSGL